MLNIISLIFGACGWLFGWRAMTASDAFASHRNTLVSYSLCAVSLLTQLFEINRRANLGDYAAIGDTIHGVLLASVVMVCITVILNLTALVKAKNK